MSAQEQVDETIETVEAKPTQGADASPPTTRARSTIVFPYTDLEDAMRVAKAVHTYSGPSCKTEQLAAQLKAKGTDDSAFKLSLNSARIFGLLTYAQGTVSLTPLGIRAADPQTEAGAKVEAFLQVPLYNAVHEQFKGTVLPEMKGLENAMAALGVVPNQADKARQVFQRAANQAGFFAHGTNRLVLPSVKGNGAPKVDQRQTPPPDGEEPRRHKGGGGDGPLHPFIDGLIKTLPEAGSLWPIDGRRKWLLAACSVFDLIYTAENEAASLRVEIDKG
jgi:hypothetical protein